MGTMDEGGGPFVVGVDGGATHTVGVLARVNGDEIRRATVGPTNPHSVDGAAVAANLRRLFDDLLAGMGGRHQVGASVFGFAGAGRQADAQVMEAAVRACGATRRVSVTTDARVAFHGALDGAPGLLLIGGTGSMCYGRDAEGRESRAGGWGSLLDDVGSGYDLGLSSLRAVARQTDGRLPRSPWGGATLRAAGTDAEDLVRWTGAASKQDIAALAPVVLSAAAGGDEQAGVVVTRAAADLAALVPAAALGLDLGRQPAVALTGGVLLHSGFYRGLVVDALREACPHATARTPVHDPAWGAVLMAREALAEEAHHAR